MEIADYLEAARRRLWILVLVPVLAAGAALAYGLMSPKTYSATATVLSPSLVGTPYSQFIGPQANAQFVSAFSASAKDPTVLAQTSRDTGTRGSNLSSNVTVAQVGASSNVMLTYSGEKRTASQPVAQALASNALTNIYSAQGRIADVQVDSAKKALDAANKALNAYVVKVGVANPPAAYQAAVGQVAWLQQTQATFAAEGNSDSAMAIKGSITAAQKRASTIGATLTPYNNLLSAQTLATTSYESVLGDQRQAQAQAAAAADPGVIQTSAASPDMTGSSIFKLVIPVFGAAVLLAVILLAVIEFIGAARRQTSRDIDARRRQQAGTGQIVRKDPGTGRSVRKGAGAEQERVSSKVGA